ncbi:hypothetical protein ADK77_11925 [Streptomyces antibioticus]|nr:hypothetical protein ADK77_11925 [Streptomyces antibioticus]
MGASGLGRRGQVPGPRWLGQVPGAERAERAERAEVTGPGAEGPSEPRRLGQVPGLERAEATGPGAGG